MARGEKLKEYDILETKWEKCSEEQWVTNAEDWELNSAEGRSPVTLMSNFSGAIGLKSNLEYI